MTTSLDIHRIAFVQAGWHADLLDGARDAFQTRMTELGVPADRIHHFDVPGAFEIPLFARRLAKSGQYDAIVGAALVVNGGIYRHEFVAQAVVDGLMRVQLDTDVPVFSMSLTPHHFHSHDEHYGFFDGHLRHKGREVADACVGMLLALANLGSLVAPENAGSPTPSKESLT
ncbi:riboflavin synthase subunit beta [Pandoraea anapnoica]|uniref:6,7-dimethyl-8-ribityllumazine synthase n=1 Tax=Pandoraea anapnoica TaxID=2508301 RepID=A0A5E4ZZX3_9BURK|nr:6,7-dimethyl-8-ribityllumazine synthase [Pandoraea anapnoica]VVE66951.1 riboflavin synthase subunit beta [Pandoraea anapnoica]